MCLKLLLNNIIQGLDPKNQTKYDNDHEHCFSKTSQETQTDQTDRITE